MSVNAEFHGMCNAMLKFGNCNRKDSCFFVKKHKESLALHNKLKSEGKCVWCALGHCKKCTLPPKKTKPAKKVDSEGWQIVGTQAEEIKPKPEKPISEKLIDWLEAIKKGDDIPMPEFEGQVKFSYDGKTIVFIKGKGFVIKTKTIVEVQEIDTKSVPISLADAWKTPSNQIYTKEQEEIKSLLVQEDQEKSSPMIFSEPSSDNEEDEEESAYWKNHQEVGKQALEPQEEPDEVWNSFE